MHIISLGLENFRGFTHRNDLDFAPVTLLTGPNSSGKSSVIKALLLLKDTIPNHLGFNFLNNLDIYSLPFPSRLDFSNKSNHSLRSFKTILNNDSKKECLSFSLPFFLAEIEECPLARIDLEFSQYNDDNYLSEVRIYQGNELLLSQKTKPEDDSAEAFEFQINVGYFLKKNEKGQIIRKLRGSRSDWEVVSNGTKVDLFDTGSEGLSNSSFETIGTSEYTLATEEVAEQNIFKLKEKPEVELLSDLEKEEIYKDIARVEESLLQDIIDNDGMIGLRWARPLGEPSLIKDVIKRYFEIQMNSFYNSKNKISHFSMGTNISHFDFISKDGPHNTYVLDFSIQGEMITGMFDRLLHFNFLEFGKALKNTHYYPNPDVKFENLITEEDGLVYRMLGDYLKMKDEDEEYVKKRYPVYMESYRFLRSSLQFLGIGENLIVNKISDYGYEVLIENGKENIRLKDAGFGIRKLVSIILLIASRSYKESSYYFEDNDGDVEYMPNTIILEEPESNLHPKLQSKLADVVLFAAKNFNSQFIIETHSEYLIRKFQYLTAKEEDLKKGDIVLQYFFDNIGQQSPKKIEIQKDGMLTDDFGPGFFDEANNLAIELFNLKKSQSN